MKKYWPLVVTAIAALAPIVSPLVQAFYSAHPVLMADMLAAWGVVKLLLPSPINK